MAAHREIETTFVVDDGVEIPDLHRAPSVERVGEPVRSELHAVYYDTVDQRLAEHRITVRRRTGSADDGWHVKLPTATADERTELRYPLTDTDDGQVPDAVVDQIRAYVRDDEVQPIATLHTERVERHLLAPDGRDLAVMADDRVRAHNNGATTVPQVWREIEIELVDGDEGLLAECTDVLLDAGLRPSPFSSKLHHALGRPRESEPPPRRPRTVGEVVQRHLTAQVHELMARDREARADEPDGVHKMRVATRRLRSALKTFRPVLQRDETDPIRDELAWLGAALGRPRDAEVLLARLVRDAHEVPAELLMGPVVSRIETELRANHGEVHDQLLEALDEPRYFRLLDRLDELVERPPLDARADRRSDRELERLLQRTARRVERRAKAVDDTADARAREEALHEVRKAAKQARYASEAFSPALGRSAEKLARRMEALQELLGELQDSVQSRNTLRELAVAAYLANENGFSFGLMYGNEVSRAARVVEQYPNALRRALRAARRPRRTRS